jgi:hypothetical protein
MINWKKKLDFTAVVSTEWSLAKLFKIILEARSLYVSRYKLYYFIKRIMKQVCTFAFNFLLKYIYIYIYMYVFEELNLNICIYQKCVLKFYIETGRPRNYSIWRVFQLRCEVVIFFIQIESVTGWANVLDEIFHHIFMASDMTACLVRNEICLKRIVSMIIVIKIVIVCIVTVFKFQIR